MIDTPLPVRAIAGDGPGAAGSGLSDAALLALAQEVIVRLARWAQNAAPTPAAPRPETDTEALGRALIGPEYAGALAIVQQARARGVPTEDLTLHYIGGAARLLGRMWEDDRIGFSDMALAAGRMLHLLRDLRDLVPEPLPKRGRAALFAAVPGETHILGVTMAADVFRKRGWEIELQLGRDEAALADRALQGGYPIVGLSASSAERVRALGRTIVALRLRVPGIMIFVGGTLARLEPDIALRTGADGAGWKMERCLDDMEALHARMLALHTP